MDVGEVKAAEFLSLRGLQPEGFYAREAAKLEHPDFRVFKDDRLVFFCEVRAVARDGRCSDRLRSVRSHAAVRVLGTDRSVECTDRLTNHIRSAISRFDAVNPLDDYPNVLILVNDDILCGFNDLIAVATGSRAHRSEFPVYPTYSQGHPKQEKGRIHLYVWLDENKPAHFFFNRDSDAQLRKLCECFALKRESLHRV